MEELEQINTLEAIQSKLKMNNYAHTFEYCDKIVLHNNKLNSLISTEYSIETFDKPLSNALHNYIANDLKEFTEFSVLNYTDESNNNKSVFLFALKDWKYGETEDVSTIAILMKPEWLFNNLALINKVNENQEKSIYLLADNNLYNTNADLVTSENLSALKDQVLKKSDDYGYFNYKIDNEKYKIAYIYNKTCNWYILSLQPYNVFMAQINQITIIFLIITIIAMLLALSLAFFFSKRIYAPVNTVVNSFLLRNNHPTEVAEIENELNYIVHSYEKAISQISSQKRTLRNSKKYLADYWIQRLLLESDILSEKELQKNDVETLLELCLQQSFLVIALNIDENSSFFKMSTENQNIFRYAVENITQEIMNNYGSCAVSDMGNEIIIILIELSDSFEEKSIKEGIKKIQETVEKFYEFTISAAISNRIETYQHISQAYKKIIHLLNYKLIYGNGCIIFESAVENLLESNESMFILQREEALEKLFTNNNKKAFQTELRNIFNTIRTMKYSEIMSNINYLNSIIYKFIKLNYPAFLNNPKHSELVLGQAIFSNTTLREIEEHILEIYTAVHEDTDETIPTTNRMLAATIVKIIEENYKDPNLSQDWIASTLKLSYGNTGKIFKSVEKVSIGEYINQIRLKHACELLENTNHNITEVFSSVGFVNQSYFFTLFKKYFGCTPKQYQLQKTFQQL